MEPVDARYPFLGRAREAVRASGVDLTTLVATADPVVDRARERVERALLDGTTESETPHDWDTREELLSYPVARILVSLLDADAAVEKYATAEAQTAHTRFTSDFVSSDGRRDRIDRQTLLAEFDLAADCRAEPARPTGDSTSSRAGRGTASTRRGSDWFWLGVGSYLSLADPTWGTEWRLVNRELADGEVRVTREELDRLLEAGVRARVAAGLPFEGVDDAVAAELEREVSDLRELLAERTGTTEVDTLAPELFPPCLRGLLDRVRQEESISSQARFALLAFLAAIGLDQQEVLMLSHGELTVDTVGKTLDVLRDGDGTQYPPPSCRTLEAYGVCENTDDHRSVAGHPLDYYEKKLRRADDVTDWRERETT
jgi:DNA primase large subunit